MKRLKILEKIREGYLLYLDFFNLKNKILNIYQMLEELSKEDKLRFSRIMFNQT